MTSRLLKRLLIVLLSVESYCHAQGAFQNLDLESASLVSINDAFYNIQFTPAFPSWSGYVDGVQQNGALYNNVFLDSSGLGIIDSASPVGSVIQGNYTAVLAAGLGLSTSMPADTALAQTGSVPDGTQSLLFAAQFYGDNNAFAVSMDGQTLSLFSLSSGPNYILYGADIRSWAGRSATLAFTVFAEQPHVNNNYLYLDAIQFSDVPIPEPFTCSLVILGAFAIGWRFRRKAHY